MLKNKIQNLELFTLPKNFRGRSIFIVQLWWIVQKSLFSKSPQFMYRWRRWLLRSFGAKIGKSVLLRPSVTVTYPWKVSIGDFSWVGDDVVLYSLGEIVIGDHAVISQRSYFCTADHDATQKNFPIRANKIVVEREAWIASDVFIAPGVTIGAGAVIGARSSVFKDMPAEMLCFGSPCTSIKHRKHLKGSTFFTEKNA